MFRFDEYARLAAHGVQRAQSWRIGLAVALIVVIYVVANLAILIAGLGLDQLEALPDLVTASAYVTQIILLPFGVILVLTLLVHKVVHHGPVGALFQVAPGRHLRQFAIAALLALAAILLPALLPLEGPAVSQQMPVAHWARLLPLSLALLAIQTLTEEVVFRGYLQRYLAAAFPNPLVWWFVPSLLFGLLHYDTEIYGENAALVALSAFLLGLLLAEITARTGSIAASWGIHFANNAVSLLIWTLPGPLSGLGLYVAEVSPADPVAMRLSIISGIVQILVIYALYLGWLRWRHHR